MNALNNLLTAIRNALNANRKAGEALKAYAPTYNKLSPEQQYAVRWQVAQIIAQAYGCEAIVAQYNGERTIGFKGGDKGKARNALRYYFPSTNDSRGHANKVDAVAQLLKSYAKLSKAEQRRFLASI